MLKPWKKMTKNVKQACAKKTMLCGFATFLFGIIWMYFASTAIDVWSALPPTAVVMGLLIILYGLIKRMSI